MSEENKKELLSSALELKRAYEELQAFPAWATIKAQLEKQVRVRTDRIMLTPLTNLDAAMEQEYAKGEVAGIRLVLCLPEQTVEDLGFEIQQLINQMKEEENERGE